MKELAGKRILIVDDEEYLLEMMCEEFQALGAKPDIAANGVTALAMAATKSYDVIITDARMSEGDGLTFLRELQTNLPKMPPLFLCSGYNDIDTADYQQLGLTAVFTKPFDWRSFIQQIAASLESPAG